MSRGAWKSLFSPESRGTVVGYCRKYTVGHGVGVRIILGLAEIVPASCQSLRAAWSSLVYGLLYTARRPRTPWSECGRAH